MRLPDGAFIMTLRRDKADNLSCIITFLSDEPLHLHQKALRQRMEEIRLLILEAEGHE